jgi:hypothetical protein
MSKSGGTTRQIAATGPPGFQRPLIEKFLGEADKLYSGPAPTFFPGSTVAGFNPAETQGRQMVAGAVPQLQQTAGVASGSLNTLQAAQDPQNNPFLKATTDAAIRPVFEHLTEMVLPNIRGGFGAAGGFGGSRQSLAESLATKNATRQAFDATSQIGSNAYGQGLNAAQSAIQLAPNVQAAQIAPGEVLAGTGAQERALEQARIDEQIARHQYNQNLPYTRLAEFGNMISRPYGGESASQVISPETGKLEQIIGAGSSLIPLIGQLLAAFGR